MIGRLLQLSFPKRDRSTAVMHAVNISHLGKHGYRFLQAAAKNLDYTLNGAFLTIETKQSASELKQMTLCAFVV